ncbi:hypothetical protein [Pedococcus bigeumensis]|uniref:LysM peptidoglycan-binding domain-containing protein n=1 Tax=Pedococcus bigeumensis TaxID=433644 RepID=UPI002FEC142D
MVLNESQGRRRRIGPSLRPAAAIGALVGLELGALIAARNTWRVVRAPGPAALDEAVVLVVLVVGALLGAWLVVGTTVACAAHLPGRFGDRARRWSLALAPAVTRRVAAILVGAALGTTGAPGAAVAADAAQGVVAVSVASVESAGGHRAAPARVPGFALTVPTPAPSPGWTPARPAHTPAPVARLVTGVSAPQPSEVVVHRGDSLWGIVRRELGPGATDTEVAAAWPHWYAANRDVIGPDPDVLLPGQVLRAPDGGRLHGQPTGGRR